MKTETQSSADLSRLCGMIENLSVAMLTNLDDAGNLVSRPMWTLEMDGSGALWFFTDKRSTKIEYLRVVNLSFVDSAAGNYVSMSGYGEIDMNRARMERLWTPFAKPWFPDGPESINLALLKFVPATAEYWDASNSSMVRMFAMAASVIAGKPLGMGEHGTLTGLSKPPQETMPG